MDNNTVLVLTTLLPFAFLLIGFLVFKMNALKISLYTLILEILIVFIVYKMPVDKVITASVWGNISVWSSFLVLYTGQLFGQSFRSTGLLKILLNTLGKVLPTKAGKAITLSSVIGGFVGAFNGFATYPVAIPGLVALGNDGQKAAVGYMVYFSWSVAFASLFIAATIANVASGVPIRELAQIMGVYTIPLVVVSVIGFFRISGFSLAVKENCILAGLVIVGNIAAIVVFTQIFSEYYILTLIGAAVFCWALLYAYSRISGCQETSSPEEISDTGAGSLLLTVRSFAPLVIGALVVVVWTIPAIAKIISGTQLKIALWGYSPIMINLLDSPGFYILVTACCCYLFATNSAVNAWQDFKIASKRSWPSLATLALGGAMVYLMVDTGQITLLAHSLSLWGKQVYGVLFSGVAFIVGMAFGQGVPADFMLSKMQVSAAKLLSLPLAVLVAVAAEVTMGLPNPLKPSLLRYTSTLANVKPEQEGEMFRMALPWQLLQLLILIIAVLWMI